MDTLSLFNSCGAKGVYRHISCQGITSLVRQSAVLYRLLTQTIEAPKKINRGLLRKTNRQKEKVDKDDSE